jgi:hypothetical protein
MAGLLQSILVAAGIRQSLSSSKARAGDGQRSSSARAIHRSSAERADRAFLCEKLRRAARGAWRKRSYFGHERVRDFTGGRATEARDPSRRSDSGRGGNRLSWYEVGENGFEPPAQAAPCAGRSGRAPPRRNATRSCRSTSASSPPRTVLVLCSKEMVVAGPVPRRPFLHGSNVRHDLLLAAAPGAGRGQSRSYDRAFRRFAVPPSRGPPPDRYRRGRATEASRDLSLARQTSRELRNERCVAP